MEIFDTIGQKVEEVSSAQEALQKTGLDFTVSKLPMYVNIGEVQDCDCEVQVEDAFVNVRDDGRQLGVVGNRYHVIQNNEALSLLDPLIQDGELEIENAGDFGDGRRVWLQARINNNGTFEPVKGDPIEKYAIFYNSHDGSSGIGVAFTPTRVWCENMLRAVLSRAKKANRSVKLRHTQNYKRRLEEAYTIFGQSNKYFDLFEEEMKYLSGATVDVKTTKVFVDKFIPLPDTKQDGSIRRVNENRITLQNLIQNGRGTDVPGVRGTAYGLYNAAVEYSQYNKSMKGKNLPAEVRASRRAESMIFDGTLDKMSRKAESLALSAAEGTLVAA